MLVWRLTREAHAQHARTGDPTNHPLSGEGARRYGGRWNHPGTAVVYSSSSLSLAVLEYLVNLHVEDLPVDLVAVTIEVPDDLPRSQIRVKNLPRNWRVFPAVEELKDIGTNWTRRNKTPVLIVPSVVIPTELNCLINPAHPQTARVKVASIKPFSLDTRLRPARN